MDNIQRSEKFKCSSFYTDRLTIKLSFYVKTLDDTYHESSAYINLIYNYNKIRIKVAIIDVDIIGKCYY